MSRRWEERPPDSTWGDWGEDDELGRLNLIGSEQVLAAVSEVKVGRTFCLSLPMDRPPHPSTNPSRKGPAIYPLRRGGVPYFNFSWGELDERFTDVASDDTVRLDSQYSTHWDSFAHRGAMWPTGDDSELVPTYYNGFRGGGDIGTSDDGSTRVSALGVEKFAKHGIQGRGVMINLVKYRDFFGDLEVGFKEIQYVLESENIEVRSGDLVCFWTGFDQLLLEPETDRANNQYFKLNGSDERLHDWLIHSGISAVISDNPAIETTSTEFPAAYHGSSLPLHELCLFKLGIPLGEMWHLAELAQWMEANSRIFFLLTAPPLRLTGAVGAPVTPIATL